jgi:hypothetical protein
LSVSTVTLSLSKGDGRATHLTGEQRRLYFFPLPHGQRELAEILRLDRRIVRGVLHQS